MLSLISIKRGPPSDRQLQAIAASGATGLAKRAQAELQRRKAEQLRGELGR